VRRQTGAGVSIHAFRGEGDRNRSRKRVLYAGFNPRLPGGRRRLYAAKCGWSIAGFNPRLPGGRRPHAADAYVAAATVSIHAFRGEGDRSNSRSASSSTFQSTPSGGKATSEQWLSILNAGVSIHAFRGEGDVSSGGLTRWLRSGFNPRLPGGRRLVGWVNSLVEIWFQSTPSGGKATCAARSTPPRRSVSIHAFRGEGDSTRMIS